MFLGILHRMILWELTKVFVVSLIGITGILLMAGIVAEASQQGLGPMQILEIIPLLIPSTLPYTLPTTTLFATCVVYGRLAHDNEILAIKAAGVNVLVVLVPAVFLGLLMSATTMTLYYRVIPHTHGLMRTMFLNDVEELLYAMLRKDGKIAHPNLPYSINVQGVHGQTLESPVFKRRNKEGKWDVTTKADEAQLHVNMATRMVKVEMRRGLSTGEHDFVDPFDYREYEVPLPETMGNDYIRRPRDMSWQELYVNRAKLETHIQETQKRYAQAKVRAATGQTYLIAQILGAQEAARSGVPVGSFMELGVAARVANSEAFFVVPPGVQPSGNLAKDLDKQNDLVRYLQAEMQNFNVELLMRPALSFGCLCFVLVGCPVGIWLSRSDYLSSFITCFLPIVIIYYPLMLCGPTSPRAARPCPFFASGRPTV